ncbi:hypothetical protein ACXWOI_09395, partial [Streptococcus pyogenes]
AKLTSWIMEPKHIPPKSPVKVAGKNSKRCQTPQQQQIKVQQKEEKRDDFLLPKSSLFFLKPWMNGFCCKVSILSTKVPF